MCLLRVHKSTLWKEDIRGWGKLLCPFWHWPRDINTFAPDDGTNRCYTKKETLWEKCPQDISSFFIYFLHSNSLSQFISKYLTCKYFISINMYFNKVYLTTKGKPLRRNRATGTLRAEWIILNANFGHFGSDVPRPFWLVLSKWIK